MRLRDRFRRWWNPANWRDEHPEISDGDGFPLTAEQRGETQTTRDRRAGTPYAGRRKEELNLPHGFEHR